MSAILLIGGCYHKGSDIPEEEKIERAAHVLFSNLVEGISATEKVIVINDIRQRSFPKNSMLIKKRREILQGNVTFIDYGYINLPVLNNITKASAIFREVKRCYKECDKAIIYCMYTPYLVSIPFLKRCSLNTALMVPDLPLYMDTLLYKKPIKKLLKTIDFLVQKRLIRKVDEFFLLSKYMNDVLNQPNEKVQVMEGMHANYSANKTYTNQTDILRRIKKRNDNNFVVCYTGSTNEEYGIKDLVDSFQYLKHYSVELWIFGRGDYDSALKALSADSNVRYFGVLSTSEIHDLQHHADLLINPRKAEKDFTKYSFPSKTIEYILSGKPTVCYQLKGIPEEYNLYLNYITGDRPQDIATSIENVLSNYSEAKKKAEAGRIFVIEEKNAYSQADRMLQFMNSRQG